MTDAAMRNNYNDDLAHVRPECLLSFYLSREFGAIMGGGDGRLHVAEAADGDMTRVEKGGSMLDDDNADCATGLADDGPAKAGGASMRARGHGRMGGSFLEAIQADFEAHGAAVVARIRDEKPESYLKLVASILPKDFSVAGGTLDDLSDEQLIDRIRVLDAAVRPLLNKRKSGARRSGRGARADRMTSSVKPG